METAFVGMPDEGLAFLEDLEERNTKEFFDANKGVFKEQVQAPFTALVEAAAARLRRSVPGIGQPKVFRIYRDLRFSKDKTPYKTHQGAYVAAAPSTGWYVEISARASVARSKSPTRSCRRAAAEPLPVARWISVIARSRSPTPRGRAPTPHSGI